MTKRILSLAFASLALAGQVMAQPGEPRCITPHKPAPQRAAETSATSTVFGYCGDLQTALAPAGDLNTKKGAAMQINAAIARKYAGAKVTAVLVANGTTQSSSAKIVDIDIFCSTSLNNDPIATASGKMDLQKFGAYTEYKLDKPVDIEIGKTFYVGYTFTHDSSDDYPVAVDYAPSTWPGGFIGWTMSGSENMQWENISAQYGMAGIRLRIEGDNLPQNQASLTAFSLAASTLEAGVPTMAAVAVINEAANAIESVGLTYSLGDSEPQTVTGRFDTPLAPNLTGVAYVTLTPEVTGANQSLSLKVCEVNGQPYSNENDFPKTATLTVIEQGSGFARNVVIEEKTGTWCGYCPRGIVGMEKIKAEITDGSLIPIAVHSSDPMAVSSYSAINSTLNGAPSAMVNRNFISIGQIDPNYNELKLAYEIARQDPAVAEITINSVEEGTRVTTFDISTKFAMDETNARYRIALAAVEDNVGPYPQTNYYAGSNVDLDGWEKNPDPTSTIFNDVARVIKTYQGAASTVPSAIEAGTTYSYTKGALDNTAIKDRTNARYVALLINSLTGRIENAASIPSPSSDAALDNIGAATENEGPVRYFNLQGQPVENPVRGQLLIRTCGSRSSKIVF
ncbi:MAG: hypothetical protein K2H33_06910 [Muribaculaceae bacterium]|nr:hypothetical protein [Muribaculaceae bacterium]